ncbi:hypothetical protein [Mesorhizobium sp. M1216]|uniref:hypothetical protein n=1 Tax=Mesorhizobium sp. M1216 TaxID=2957069 RepID=UPI00333C0666
MPSSPDLEAAVYAEIDPSGRTTSPATIEQVKDLYVRSKTSAPDELGYVAKMYGSALTTGRKARELKEWRDRIPKLTANRVTAVAAGYLVPDDSTTVSLSCPILRIHVIATQYRGAFSQALPASILGKGTPRAPLGWRSFSS